MSGLSPYESPTVAWGQDLLSGGQFSYFIADGAVEEDKNVVVYSDSPSAKMHENILSLISCVSQSIIVSETLHVNRASGADSLMDT